jgi:purine-binding chemotaxis protein CheW
MAKKHARDPEGDSSSIQETPPAHVASPSGRPHDDDANDGGERASDIRATDIRQFVTFIAGNEVFAVDMAPVQEIIRVPQVVHVPLAPATLDGLANLRGKVLPIFSLRRIFGYAEQSHDDATRALVIDMGQPLGFVVDKVVSVVGVDAAKIEGVGSLEGAMNTELLSGIIKDVAGHAMIMVLDFAKLVEREFSEIATIARHAALSAGITTTENDEDDATAGNELQLVSFEVADQEYAIAIADVQEIVQVPEQIVRVPRSERHVLGVMTLRSRLLPLVSLRHMFGLPTRAADEQSRIVVVSVGGAGVGIVMDSVNEVLRVPNADVDPMPPLLARDSELADIAQICRLDGGKRLVSIISAANLFRHSAVREAVASVTTSDDTHAQTSDDTVSANDENHDDDEQVVVFRLGNEEFGVPIAIVQEIVRVPETLTQVPRAPEFVEGVINLRGAVLPVIDLRRRLGLATAERSDRQRVMVFLIDGMRTGYIVDFVAEVLKIPKAAIEAAPRLSASQEHLLARVANLEQQKRMVQLIAPAHLVEGQEFEALAGMAA